jgi:hypothetical protein
MPTYLKPNLKQTPTEILLVKLSMTIDALKSSVKGLEYKLQDTQPIYDIIEEIDRRGFPNDVIGSRYYQTLQQIYAELRNEIYSLIGWENQFNRAALLPKENIYELSDEEILDIPDLTHYKQGQNNMTEQTYTINVKSRFILTQSAAKRAFGPGFHILSVEVQKDASELPIIDIDSAALSIIQTGYRALARAHHPDLGGSEETMKILNKCRTELKELVESLRR